MHLKRLIIALALRRTTVVVQHNVKETCFMFMLGIQQVRAIPYIAQLDLVAPSRFFDAADCSEVVGLLMTGGNA